MEVIVEEPKNISVANEVKYSSTARLYKGDKVVGVGYAICSSKEALKKSFDEYAILSMAQTRSISKAYRNKIGFIMKLAGFQATPAEEMHKVNEVPQEGSSEPIIQQGEVIKSYDCHGAGQGGCPDGASITQQQHDFTMKVCKKPLCKNCYNKFIKK